VLRAALPLIAWPTLQPKNPVRKNAEPTQNPARNQGLLTQDAPVGQTVPNKSSAQKVKSRVGKDSLVDQATKVFPDPSNGPNSFSKPLDVTTFPGDASPSERIPESAGTFAVPIPPITPGIPLSNNESELNEEVRTENVETLTLLPETEIQNSPPDNCGPNTIVIPTELCSSSRSMEGSSSSDTDSQKSESTFRSPSARYKIVNGNKTIASLQSLEDDPEQLSYFDFTANDGEPPDFINYFQLDHVDPILRPRLEEILRKHEKAFLAKGKKLGCTDLIEHTIRLEPGQTPIKRPPFVIPRAHEEEVEALLQTMVDDGIIEECSSPWAAPLLIVRKTLPSGEIKLRPCIDYRALNSVTIRDE